MTRAAWIIAIAFATPLCAAEPRVEVKADVAEFRFGPELVGRYLFDAKQPKPYLWPLNAPGGIGVTRPFPMEPAAKGGTADHIHHKSAWFSHGDILVDGIEPAKKVRGVEGFDFWDEAPGHSTVVCVGASKAGDAKLTLRNEWRSPEGRKLLDETRTVTLYDRGGDRMFVFDIDIHASVAALTFADTKEGAFAIRVRDDLRVGEKDKINPKSKITNAEGKINQAGCWGQLSAWCDYSGEVEGKTVGVAILADPTNPQPSCWHSRDYGLMAANPFGRSKSGFPAMKGRTDAVKVAKGDHLKMRFGLLVHAGDASNVAGVYEWFAKLPH
ncbi:MAG: PmoA family protein [Gemmataceae bacterium]